MTLPVLLIAAAAKLMPLPLLLGVAAGGIAFVVLLAHLLWSGVSAKLGDEVSLAAKLEHEYPGHELDQLLLAADRQMALAADVTSGDYLLFYVHGIHVNLRAFSAKELLTCRVEQVGDAEAALHIRIDAFDRSDFVLALATDTNTIKQAHEWEERLQAALTPNADATQE